MPTSRTFLQHRQYIHPFLNLLQDLKTYTYRSANISPPKCTLMLHPRLENPFIMPNDYKPRKIAKKVFLMINLPREKLRVMKSYQWFNAFVKRDHICMI